ncbi:TIR domain-containing protein [Piscinibacter sakaiensis]|uniref:TIR domain-containing protein n=1 Tax=Piscinibacter sakaiensis TaxID=1547922 RepID=UPI003AAC0679
MIKLFISYRRGDSMHAAQRVRMSLQHRFGDDAVFIDREIPPGTNWEQHLEQMLVEATGVVVMIGDDFLKLLRRNGDGAAVKRDPLVWEIATALRLRKPIYPVLFGALDMPDRTRLPEPIRELASFQAVFAREPAFDVAIGELIKTVARQQGGLDLLEAAASSSERGAGSARPGAADLAVRLAIAAAAAWACWWVGRVIGWLAEPAAAALRSAESASWLGLRYLLCTALWGFGPYLGWWLVAQLRARAKVPLFNLQGVLLTVNVIAILLAGGSFLLLSTLPGWRLQPLLIFPDQPQPAHYVLLALGLLLIMLAAIALVVCEPLVRSADPARRRRGLRLINLGGAGVAACVLWFAASIAASLPALGRLDPVPVVGYLMLCPTLSLSLFAWVHVHPLTGLQGRPWPMIGLFALGTALIVSCTIALFAYGPARLLGLVGG